MVGWAVGRYSARKATRCHLATRFMRGGSGDFAFEIDSADMSGICSSFATLSEKQKNLEHLLTQMLVCGKGRRSTTGRVNSIIGVISL